MELLARAFAEGRDPDPDELMAAIPYCRYLGIRAVVKDGAVSLVMPFAERLVGNPMLPALHGGVIGSLLETAAIVQVVWETRAPKMPKPVDITVDYLRTGKPVETYARARIARHEAVPRTEKLQDIGRLPDDEPACLQEGRREGRPREAPSSHQREQRRHAGSAARLARDIAIARARLLERQPNELAAALNGGPVIELVDHLISGTETPAPAPGRKCLS